MRELTVEDVVDSRMIAWPLRLLECCMISDGGGAVVIASKEVAANCAKKPVWVIGGGEATKYRENGGDITVSAGAQSGPRAFADAGVTPDEIDVLMAYDSFSITVMCMIEDLGFCNKGEGGEYVAQGTPGIRRPAQARDEHRWRRAVLQSPRRARNILAHRGGAAAQVRVQLSGGWRSACGSRRQRRTTWGRDTPRASRYSRRTR